MPCVMHETVDLRQAPAVAPGSAGGFYRWRFQYSANGAAPIRPIGTTRAAPATVYQDHSIKKPIAAKITTVIISHQPAARASSLRESRPTRSRARPTTIAPISFSRVSAATSHGIKATKNSWRAGTLTTHPTKPGATKTIDPNANASAVEIHLRPVIEVHMETAILRHIKSQIAMTASAAVARSFALASCSQARTSDLRGFSALDSRIIQTAITRTIVAQPIAALIAAD